MIAEVARRQEVLAHIGGALLSAQLVEHFIVLLLSPSPASDADTSGLDAFLTAPKARRTKRLNACLSNIEGHKIKIEGLERDLSCFLDDRNKLVHCFHELGPWNFKRSKDCHESVNFLRTFIDRANALQQTFVSVLSIRDAQFRTRVSEAHSKAYEQNFKRVHGPLNIRWFDRIDA